MSTRTVGTVMTRDVVTVTADTRFRDIVDVLQRLAISAVPVVDTDGHVIGVVSEADLMYKVQSEGGAAAMLVDRRRRRSARAKADGDTAAELMSAPAVTVGPDATVAEAARRMELSHVKRLPVVDDGRLVGIVSRRDVLKTYLRADADIERDVHRLLDGVLAIDRTEVTPRLADGVVTLVGTVDRRTTAEVALRLVAAVDGVVRVVNGLSWRLDDTTRAVARFVTT